MSLGGSQTLMLGFDAGSVALKAVVTDSRGKLRESLYRRTHGRPIETASAVLRELLDRWGDRSFDLVAGTGSAGATVCRLLEVPFVNEVICQATAVRHLLPEVRTLIEMGGQDSKLIFLPHGPSNGRPMTDFAMNGNCAAGTGSFLDQQASRLGIRIEQFGSLALASSSSPAVAGRCSVFAKSDMVHAQQRGFRPPEVLRGLCNAVATNFKSAVVKGRVSEPPVAVLGGVSANSAVVDALCEVFELQDGALMVPDAADSLGAVGAAIIAADATENDPPNLRDQVRRLSRDAGGGSHAFPTSPPLSLERVTLLRDRVKPYESPEDNAIIDAYLGLDIGSVGTKLVLIDGQGDVIDYIFTRTEGRPIEVVTRCLRELEERVGWRVRVCAVGSTGSGRELVGELVGADSINDEITAHKTGATFVGDRLLGKRPDTIFEIGGQDSKYISLESEGGDSTDTVVVDFTMNEACAAGTGSFLEERAEELGVSIKDEFAALAFRSKAPLKLGERCTVFMERDVNTYMQRGAQREDVIAGLAYSIAYNYINRVVRGRRIGDCIFFQGGTAYNDAVAAAFSIICGKEIIVPPHNVLLGAIGVALLAKEKVAAARSETRFRGYDVEKTDYALREFTCKGCGNRCSVQEFNVQGEKTFWGDKCSDRYRKRAKTDRKPVIPDLVAARHELLQADDDGDPPGATTTIGIPLAMYTYDLLPLWRRFFRDCGFKVTTSAATDRRTVRLGLDSALAEPCFPIIVAHGHVAELVKKNVDYLWLPNILSADIDSDGDLPETHVCPWGQTLPWVIRQAPQFQAWQARILCPTLRFRAGLKRLRKTLVDAVAALGVRRSVAARAFDAGWAAQQRFRSMYEQAGREALEMLERTGEAGMVLVGRPYNIHDLGVSISTAKKLRDHYGVNILPIDALPLADIDVRDVNENMYWEYGQKILAAAKLVGQRSNLHIIFITNFKCGPDSFLKGYIRPASGKPFLSLQFDGHSNDAGTMTRCEAYLDSKGILRWWRTCPSKATEKALSAGPSTSPRCPTPLPG